MFHNLNFVYHKNHISFEVVFPKLCSSTFAFNLNIEFKFVQGVMWKYVFENDLDVKLLCGILLQGDRLFIKMTGSHFG